MTIGQRIGWATAGNTAVLLALAGGMVMGVGSLLEDIALLQTRWLPGQAKAAKVYEAAMALRHQMNAELVDMAAGSSTLSHRQAEVQEAHRAFVDELKGYNDASLTAEDRQALETAGSAMDRAMQAWDEVRTKSKSKVEEALAHFRTDVRPVYTEMERQLDSLKDRNARAAADSTAELLRHSKDTRTVGLMISGIALLLAAVFAWMLNRSLSGLLSQAVYELHLTAEQVASAAAQVSSSGQALARGASEQAASLEETSASSDEVNATARKNSEDTSHAADLVTQSQCSFEEANRSLELMVTAMDDIKAQSEKISKIIKVIDEIAFQTNILALNAAVEAARAGDAGMGFAVVAEEVRSLAQRCAKAAKDITELIEESIEKSYQGKDKVDRVAASMQAVSNDAAQVQVLVSQVNASSREQTRGIELVARAVIRIQQVTQNNAASSEENAAASEELSAQAAALQDVVARLGAAVGSQSAVRPSSV